VGHDESRTDHIASQATPGEAAVQRMRQLEEELLEARQELAHAARVASLGVLTAAIAHEVNQPLSGILTNAAACLRILARDTPDLERARETARRTIRDCTRAADVISRLRVLFSKRAPTREAVSLGDAAKEVIGLAAFELRRNGVVVRLDLAKDVPSVTGDPVQLQQVILNLVLNACEAMRDVTDRPRSLVIRTERGPGHGVLLSVIDSGVGIDAVGADQLFQPFYTGKPGGMGIGLSVSRTIVESHRGRLWAAPNKDGPGATFALALGSAA
jgi:C4-dicarboxylate-specific signal transduction histidine kinase